MQNIIYREIEAGIYSRIDNKVYLIIINKGGNIKIIIKPFNNK